MYEHPLAQITCGLFCGTKKIRLHRTENNFALICVCLWLCVFFFLLLFFFSWRFNLAPSLGHMSARACAIIDSAFTAAVIRTIVESASTVVFL